LGTGKTCSAIGIAEEMRSYMKQVGVTHKILIIASPNVQNNFRTQFFDETKLKQENGLWSLNTCIGEALLREINPTNLTDIPKEKVISQMNAIMNNYYSFMGYTEFANYIERHTNVPEDSGVDPEKIRIKKIQKVFNNRLVIIDEVHNIRNTDDNKNKRIAMLLMGAFLQRWVVRDSWKRTLITLAVVYGTLWFGFIYLLDIKMGYGLLPL
jgi:hypothetical protein